MKDIVYYLLLPTFGLVLMFVISRLIITDGEIKKYKASSLEELKSLDTNLHTWIKGFDIPINASELKLNYYIDDPYSAVVQYIDNDCQDNINSDFVPITKEGISFEGEAKKQMFEEISKEYKCLKTNECLYFDNKDKNIISVIDNDKCPFKIAQFQYR